MRAWSHFSFVYLGIRVDNPSLQEAEGRLAVSMPEWLARKGWELSSNVGDQGILLAPRGSQEIRLRLRPGEEFSAEEVGADDTIDVTTLVDGLIVGGMSYPIDPRMKDLTPTRPETDPAGLSELVECIRELGFEVRRVRPKRIIVALEVEDHDC